MKNIILSGRRFMIPEYITHLRHHGKRYSTTPCCKRRLRHPYPSDYSTRIQAENKQAAFADRCERHIKTLEYVARRV